MMTEKFSESSSLDLALMSPTFLYLQMGDRIIKLVKFAHSGFFVGYAVCKLAIEYLYVCNWQWDPHVELSMINLNLNHLAS